MFHGEIKGKEILVGGRTHFKTVRYCVFHGEIALFTCDDWDAKHAMCSRREPARAASATPVSILSNIEDFWQHGL